jgi:RNA chaperone Hfq
MSKRTSGGRTFQEDLLGHLADANLITTVYLRNRMSLRGRIREFDPYVLLLEPLDGSPATLIYKSAIVSISGPQPRPQRPPQRPARPAGVRGPNSFAPPRGPAGPPRSYDRPGDTPAPPRPARDQDSQ